MLGEMIGEHQSLNITNTDDDLRSICIDASLYESGTYDTMTKKLLLERLDNLFKIN